MGETNGVNGQHSDTEKVINEILGIPLPVPSREWLYNHMTERGYSTAIQQWLGSNLVGTRGGFKWAFEISGATLQATHGLCVSSCLDLGHLLDLLAFKCSSAQVLCISDHVRNPCRCSGYVFVI